MRQRFHTIIGWAYRCKATLRYYQHVAAFALVVSIYLLYPVSTIVTPKRSASKVKANKQKYIDLLLLTKTAKCTVALAGGAFSEA